MFAKFWLLRFCVREHYMMLCSCLELSHCSQDLEIQVWGKHFREVRLLRFCVHGCYVVLSPYSNIQKFIASQGLSSLYVVPPQYSGFIHLHRSVLTSCFVNCLNLRRGKQWFACSGCSRMIWAKILFIVLWFCNSLHLSLPTDLDFSWNSGITGRMTPTTRSQVL